MNQMNQQNQNQQNDMAKKGVQGQGIDTKQNDAAKRFGAQDQTGKHADAGRTEGKEHDMEDETELSADADVDAKDDQDEELEASADTDSERAGRSGRSGREQDEDTSLNSSGVQEGKKPPTEIHRKAV